MNEDFIEKTGSIVQFDYSIDQSMRVRSQIVPKQGGTGDPSPTNVRPIVAWDKVKLVRCGSNLLDNAKADYIKNGLQKENFDVIKTKSGFELVFNFETTAIASGVFSNILSDLKKVHLTATVFGSSGALDWQICGKKIKVTDKPQIIDLDTIEDRVIIKFYFVDRVNAIPAGYRLTVTNLMVTPSVSSPYEPYTGATYTAQLPLDTYGGEVDWEKKTLAPLEYSLLKGNEAEKWRLAGNGLLAGPHYAKAPPDSKFGFCNIFRYGQFTPGNAVYVSTDGNLYCNKSLTTAYDSDPEKFKAQLKKTPMQVVWKSYATSGMPITTSGSPTALPGVNTLYSDTGDTTVHLSRRYQTGGLNFRLAYNTGFDYTDLFPKTSIDSIESYPNIKDVAINVSVPASNDLVQTIPIDVPIEYENTPLYIELIGESIDDLNNYRTISQIQFINGQLKITRLYNKPVGAINLVVIFSTNSGTMLKNSEVVVEVPASAEQRQNIPVALTQDQIIAPFYVELINPNGSTMADYTTIHQIETTKNGIAITRYDRPSKAPIQLKLRFKESKGK